MPWDESKSVQCGNSNRMSEDEEMVPGTRHGWRIPYDGCPKVSLAREVNGALGGFGVTGRGVSCCAFFT